MSIRKIKEILKSRPFKLINHKSETCILQFTEIHVIREGKVIADYEIIEDINN